VSVEEIQVKEAKVVKKKTKKDLGEKVVEMAKKPAKPRAKKVVEAKEDGMTKSLAELADIPAIAAEKKVPKPRKPRQKKQAEQGEDGQPKLKKARVTKPGVSAVKVKNATDTVSSFFEHPCGLEAGDRGVTIPTVPAPEFTTVIPEQDQVSAVEEPTVPQAPAPARKRDWTPPPETVQVFENGNLPEVEEYSGGEQEAISAFGDLRNSFGYNDQTAVAESAIQRTKSGQAFKKKRRVDVVKAPKAKVKTTPKARAPAKSSRTITAIAVAQYGPAVVASDKLAADTVSAFFASRTEVVEAAKGTKEPSIGPPKRKRKSTAASDGTQTTRSKKTKKAAEAIPKLLSPKSAMKRFDHQDLLFGTSSQLVRDESPQFIRELQQAIEESAAYEEVPTARHVTRRMGVNGSVTTVIRASGGLWSLGTRDDDDELLPAEKREIRAKERAVVTAPLEQVVEEQSQLTETPTNNVIVSEKVERLENIVGNPVDNIFILAEATKPGDEIEEPVEVHIPEELEELQHGTPSGPKTVMKPPTKRLKLATTIKSNKPALLIAQRNPSPQRQALQPLPANTNILAPLEHIKSTLTSPIKLKSPSKPRTKASFLLPKADPSAPEVSTTPNCPHKNLPTLLHSSPPQTLSPPRHLQTLPQTPRSSASFKDIDTLLPLSEIEDSEPELPPSPPRLRHSPTTTSTTSHPPLPLSLSPSSRAAQRHTPLQTCPSPTKGKKAPNPPTAAKVAQFTSSLLQDTLFPLIKRAVLAAPRSRDQRRPGWYEKILLYDPIVLEDLCGWLNEGALFAAVDAGDVGKEGRGLLREAVGRFEARRRKVDDGDGDGDGEGEAEGQGKGEGKGAANNKEHTGSEACEVQDPATAAKKVAKKRKGKEKVVVDDDDNSEWRWELKPWMLQRWCEEHSICCLWREGLRGGVKAKY